MQVTQVMDSGRWRSNEMSKSKLNSYVKEQQKKGIPLSKIKEALLKVGYTQEQIKETFKQSSRPFWLITGSIGVLVFLIVFLIWNNIQSSDFAQDHGHEHVLDADYVNMLVDAELTTCLETKETICQAIATQDISLCNNDELCENEFTFLLALKGKASCNDITDAIQQLFCNSIVSKDSTQCTLLPQPVQTQCIAILSRSYELCGTLPELDKQACVDAVNIGKAILDSQIGHCDLLPAMDTITPTVVSKQRICKAAATLDSSACIDDVTSYCLENMKFLEIDFYSCHLIVDESLQQKCEALKQ